VAASFQTLLETGRSAGPDRQKKFHCGQSQRFFRGDQLHGRLGDEKGHGELPTRLQGSGSRGALSLRYRDTHSGKVNRLKSVLSGLIAVLGCFTRRGHGWTDIPLWLMATGTVR
jgi:hypothetical protein